MSGKINSKLDGNQVLKEVFDSSDESLRVKQIGGTLVPDIYDSIELTYVSAGNGIGEIETVVYKLDAATIATLNLSYDGSNRLISVVKS
jgi:hypothetical protein